MTEYRGDDLIEMGLPMIWKQMIQFYFIWGCCVQMDAFIWRKHLYKEYIIASYKQYKATESPFFTGHWFEENRVQN